MKPVPATRRSAVQKEKKEYVAPEIEKRERLTEVAQAGTTVVSGKAQLKGGCFKEERTE
jgi:hypothetical protein